MIYSIFSSKKNYNKIDNYYNDILFYIEKYSDEQRKTSYYIYRVNLFSTLL